MISIALGIFNFLPIPALDGGRGIFIIAELLRGRPVDPEKEALVHVTGFALLMVLMVFVAYHDIATIVSGKGGAVIRLRRESKPVFLKNKCDESDAKGVWIGGDHPVAVQSMTTTDTADYDKTLEQVYGLAMAGCEIVRVTCQDARDAAGLPHIVKRSPVPIVADIHFDHRMALAAIEAGVAKLRLNPGNITDPGKTQEVVELAIAARHADPHRRQHGLARARPRGAPRPHARGDGRERAAARRDPRGPRPHGTSSSRSKPTTCRRPSTPTGYGPPPAPSARHPTPCTSGSPRPGSRGDGTIKSAIGLGILLWEGIGDTLRVSLAADPVEEVPVCWGILKSLGIREKGFEITACPSCGRAEIEVVELARAVEAIAKEYTAPVKVAVMGCVVNGPGESKMADVGIAGGKGKGAIYRKGRAGRHVSRREPAWRAQGRNRARHRRTVSGLSTGSKRCQRVRSYSLVAASWSRRPCWQRSLPSGWRFRVRRR